jgi:coenzyme PQQ precursor peptide PqqA
MSEWRTPEFEEIRMDAEINCYSSAVHDLGAVGRGTASDSPAPPSASRVDGRASS